MRGAVSDIGDPAETPRQVAVLSALRCSVEMSVEADVSGSFYSFG